MARSLGKRLSVVGPAAAVGAGVAALSAAKVPDAAAALWASVLAGPFAGLWATTGWGSGHALGWAAMCWVAVAVHPLRAGRFTAAVQTSNRPLTRFDTPPPAVSGPPPGRAGTGRSSRP